ncbi:MAG: hypothetical protein JWQ97_4079 [Phenylobacterium sp.]|nr:hypothetical protein [Phenylobacterium sp.]
MTKAPYVLVVGADALGAEVIDAALDGLGLQRLSAEQPSPETMAAAGAMIVAVADAAGLDGFPQMIAAARGLPVIAVLAEGGHEAVRRLFRAGAADVLSTPFSAEALRRSVRDCLVATDIPTQPRGEVVSVIKGGGGAGATMLALHLAALFARGDPRRQRPPRRTGVLDLDLQFGDTDLALDLQPRTTVVDLIRAEQRLDVRLLEGLMVEHASGLRLLAPPKDLTPLDALSPDLALSVVEHAASAFERTLIDMPTNWSDWTAPVLARSDLIVLVTSPTVGGVVGARRVLDAIQAAGVSRPVFLVLNRIVGLLDTYEKPERVGRALDRPVDAALVSDAAAARAAERGQLVLDAFPKSPISRELASLAAKLDGRLAGAAMGPILREAAE